MPTTTAGSPPSSPARRATEGDDMFSILCDHYALVAPHFSHHMTEYWTNPSQFDPERFAEPRLEHKSHRHAWDPFGGGVHKCLGMFFAGGEVASIMHHLLRRFEWTVDPDY